MRRHCEICPGKEREISRKRKRYAAYILTAVLMVFRAFVQVFLCACVAEPQAYLHVLITCCGSLFEIQLASSYPRAPVRGAQTEVRLPNAKDNRRLWVNRVSEPIYWLEPSATSLLPSCLYTWPELRRDLGTSFSRPRESGYSVYRRYPRISTQINSSPSCNDEACWVRRLFNAKTYREDHEGKLYTCS